MTQGSDWHDVHTLRDIKVARRWLTDALCALASAVHPFSHSAARAQVSQLWKEVVTRVGKDYPEVELSHM